MPNEDRTGPNGDGPRTGRRLGSCRDEFSDRENVSYGRGCGRGRRFRR
ncbi:MAG: DUF5320 family protein [Candidatus Asgardarchaeum sp.]